MGVHPTMFTLGAVCATLLATVTSFPFPDGPHGAGPLPIPRPGSDGSYGGDNHFQYINVPAHKTFEWGYRRGNPEHNREGYLSQKDHTFKAKLKWHDAYGGHGEHYFDYNHGPGKEVAYAPAKPVYSPPKPAYGPSEPKPVYAEAPETLRRRR